jgi:hypothetical protein
VSTRSAIARPAGDGWEGRYHHFDGYPSGLGIELLRLHQDVFDGDVDRMTRVLIDDHPAGWSTINDSDWRQAPGFQEGFSTTDDPKPPRCYCHGDRAEAENAITCQCPTDTSRCDPLFIEWAYVLTPRGVGVYASESDGAGGYQHRSRHASHA